MKKTLLLCLLAFTAFTAHSQIAFQDATYLRRFISKNASGSYVLNVEAEKNPAKNRLQAVIDSLKKAAAPGTAISLAERELAAYADRQLDTVSAVFALYFDFKPGATPREKEKRIKENIFFKELIFIGDLKENGGGGRAVDLLNPAKSLSPDGLMSANVSTLADGFAKFIVKRAKQELSIAFFERFKEEISKEEFKDLRSLFPQTYGALLAIGDKIYLYETYIHTLRECFEKDLAALPAHVPALIDNHPAFFDRQPELKAALLSVFYIDGELQNGQHPGRIIENYPDDLWEKGNPDYRSVMKLVKSVSYSLKANRDTTDYWINANDLAKLKRDEVLFKVYLGLLTEVLRKEKIIFGKDTLYAAINRGVPADYLPYRAYITAVVNKARAIDRHIVQSNANASDSVKVEGYYQVYGSVLDLLQSATDVRDLPGIPASDLPDRAKEYIEIGRISGDLVIDVNRRKYAACMVDVHMLYAKMFKHTTMDTTILTLGSKLAGLEATYKTDLALLDKKQSAYIKEKDAAKSAALLKEIRDLKLRCRPYLDLKAEVAQLKNMDRLMDAIYKYGSFMASVVQAKNSDDVAAAIEAIALPTGSARIKRETDFNVALNAYCGVFGGWEQIRGVDLPFCPKKSDRRINSYGISAPIGLSISTSHKGVSFSIFASVIDIGALTAFRFVNDSTASVPDIELKDIISPGLFLSVGIPKSPISVNVGYQVGPLLRKVSAEVNSYQAGYSRISISVCVDLPLLNFYTSTKKN